MGFNGQANMHRLLMDGQSGQQTVFMATRLQIDIVRLLPYPGPDEMDLRMNAFNLLNKDRLVILCSALLPHHAVAFTRLTKAVLIDIVTNCIRVESRSKLPSRYMSRVLDICLCMYDKHSHHMHDLEINVNRYNKLWTYGPDWAECGSVQLHPAGGPFTTLKLAGAVCGFIIASMGMTLPPGYYVDCNAHPNTAILRSVDIQLPTDLHCGSEQNRNSIP